VKVVLRLRRAAIVSTVAGFVLAAAGATVAASPAPTIGGKLAAVGNEVTVTSQGSVPVRVSLTADVVKLAVATFELQPGESRELTFEGDPLGRIYAKFTTVTTATTTADANSLQLSVGLKPYTPPFDWSPVVIGTLTVAAFALLARRLRIWRWRIRLTTA
jgi:hypothetical protein